MNRTILDMLAAWKEKRDRPPLLLHGARQVGKTWVCLEFGRTRYLNTAYFNMEDSRDLTLLFERDLDPRRIIRELSAFSGVSILPQDTLIIFDEIQACPRALTSLKYFNENAPHYHIIATGSLLGLALNRGNNSFPVGKVDILTMHPLDFEEFLQAGGNGDLARLIREHFESNSEFSLHHKAMDIYAEYLIAGGMPKAVSEYINNGYNYALAAQKNLDGSYIADMDSRTA
jgi:predicted AAA+ superfamily ATPase